MPVNPERLLGVYSLGNDSILLVLIHFDLQRKTYGLLDKIPLSNCPYPKLVKDGDNYGLFVVSESRSSTDDVVRKFAFLKFTLESNRINMHLEDRKEIDYEPYSDVCRPRDLYLRQTKLWFIRHKDGHFFPTGYPFGPREPSPPSDPSAADFRISYFDLREGCPVERHVGMLEIGKHIVEGHRIFQWVQDSLFIQITESKLGVFDLLTFEWSTIEMRFVTRD